MTICGKRQLMLPMSICCDNCGNHMFTGTRFKKFHREDVEQKYRGVQIVRFYFNCNTCSSEITIRTDPETAGYTVECGATHRFNPLAYRE